MRKKALYIYVDESGNFGDANKTSRYYLVCFVYFNGVDKSYKKSLKRFENDLNKIGSDNDVIHLGPLIGGRDKYRNLSILQRRQVLDVMINFINDIDISYDVIYLHKEESINLEDKLKMRVEQLLINRLAWFIEKDQIIIYYDFGQPLLSRILLNVLNNQLNRISVKFLGQKDDRLLQVADAISTMYLASIHHRYNSITHSEQLFFGAQKKFFKRLEKLLSKKKR